MHFVIDALGISRPGGGRTSVLLQLCSVFEQDTENSYTVVVDSEELAFARFANVEQVVFKVPNRLVAHFCAQLVIPLIASFKKAALVHHTKHLCAALNPCPYVVTMNDMTTLKLAWTQSWVDVNYYRTIQRTMVRQARLVLTPSNDAKSDLMHYYGIELDKIRVIPYAASNIFQPTSNREDASIRERYGIDSNYVLFVGILAQKKNLPTLVRAFGNLKRRKNYVGKLVIVGREYPQSRERSIRSVVKELGLEHDIVFTGPVPDEYLPALYRGADVFAFPSLHEGFGIVLLEAMACGVPVITSSVSSLPEVLGDAGLLVTDFLNEYSWADTIDLVVSNGDLRAALIQKGLLRSREYSWEKVGKSTLEAYHSIVKQS